MLVAGTLDGGGKIGEGLLNLTEKWNTIRRENNQTDVQFTRIEKAGHLPMVDETEYFAAELRCFLDSF